MLHANFLSEIEAKALELSKTYCYLHHLFSYSSKTRLVDQSWWQALGCVLLPVWSAKKSQRGTHFHQEPSEGVWSRSACVSICDLVTFLALSDFAP